jgi:hypothetical protein
MADKFYLAPECIESLLWDQFDHPENRQTLIHRPHQMHQHAEKRLSATASLDDRIDAIGALKRAIFYRVKSLRELYKLKSLPISNFPKDHFPQLNFLGIIKPRLMETLIEIRRVVEHHDRDPPELKRCLELAEFCWYFLRATDNLVSRVYDGMQYGFSFVGSEASYDLYVDISPKNSWEILVYGALPNDMIGLEGRDGWVECECDYFYRNVEAPPRKYEIPTFGAQDPKFNPDDIHFKGKPSVPLRDKLLRYYFELRR